VDFVFQVTAGEAEAVRSQFATASKRNVRYVPNAFTQHRAIMAAENEMDELFHEAIRAGWHALRLCEGRA
jgi:hypothetical protein